MEFFVWIHEAVAYVASLGLTPSDWLMFALIIPIGWFIIVYGFLTKWYEDPLGWVLLSGALGMFFLLLLVIYGTVTGERIGEPLRVVVFGAIFLSWVGKDVVLHQERRIGKLEKRYTRLSTGPIPVGKDTQQ